LLKENTDYNGNTHYKGELVTDTTITINDKSYTFDASGVVQKSDSLVSDDLVKFVAGWEAFYSQAYEDPYYSGVQAEWTIGYGTTYEANSSAFQNSLSSTCTESQALVWLKEEINNVAIKIKSALSIQGVTLSQNTFDCLCDIGYNAGTDSLLNGARTTFNAVISGDVDMINTALMSWNRANSQVSEGLTKRCSARVNMCLYGIYDSTH
jgi:GH24 family phage-related lysozyme (muramidase)